MTSEAARILKRLVDTVEEQVDEHSRGNKNDHLVAARKAAKELRRALGEYVYQLQDESHQEESNFWLEAAKEVADAE